MLIHHHNLYLFIYLLFCVQVLETTTIRSTTLPSTHEEFDPYVCSLSPETKKIAKEELNEDDNIRKQALAQFREWIAKHPRIKKCRTDSVFLLRFLRTKKFNVQAACDMLEKYILVRKLYPQWFTKLDIEDPILNEIFDAGYLFPLPQRDEHGRQVIMFICKKFDPYKYTSSQMSRIHSLVCEAMMDEEENQVNGYVYINDESDITMSFVTLWSFTDLRDISKCIQNSTPMRHKESHFLNIPQYAAKAIEFFMSLLTSKLKKRVNLHKTREELHAKVNPAILPLEYGGIIPTKDIIADFKKKLYQKRAAILALDDMEVELSKDSARLIGINDGDMVTGMVGSFRKLEVD